MNPHLKLRGATAVLLALALASIPAAAQNSDQGTLVIKAADREVGVETFQLSPDSNGSRLIARAVYGGHPPVELRVTLDRATSGELAFQLDRRSGSGGGQVYAVQKRNRITVRRVDRGAEQASELPGGPTVVLLADSVFSPYLQLVSLAAEGGRPISAVFPQGPRRVALVAERVPAEAGGQLIRISGGMQGEVLLGNAGEVLRISLPSLGLEAVRKPK